MKKCGVCGKAVSSFPIDKFDDKNICLQCAERKKYWEGLLIPVPLERIRGIEYRIETYGCSGGVIYRTVIILMTLKDSKRVNFRKFENAEEVAELANFLGMNKWEMRHLRFICTKGDKSDTEVVCYPYLGVPSEWLAVIPFAVLLAFKYIIPSHLGLSLFFSVILYICAVIVVLRLFISYFNFGNINSLPWLLSYPQITFNRNGMEYICGDKTAHIPWNDITSLHDNVFLGLILISKNGRKYPIPNQYGQIQTLLRKVIIEKSKLGKMDNHSTWLGRWGCSSFVKNH